MAPSIAKANQSTNHPATKSATGSIHFVTLAREYSTSRSYCADIFCQIFSRDAVLSQTESI